ncbi:hypothetical protein C9374_013271 [Naegleria lovaniensis]|uniref:DNA/RNA-binding domain-containing protein n=1 Tax=Naegleria lovaniensis TaxID=51637 RepID=A0AA88H096_NAELO|nr:uncharacterized protein C9374_013271 [Naegleria lovaniensis]KAG2391786.1 hypothetical protein C9374_013271 [Naegleria lovaniensis]
MPTAQSLPPRSGSSAASNRKMVVHAGQNSARGGKSDLPLSASNAKSLSNNTNQQRGYSPTINNQQSNNKNNNNHNINERAKLSNHLPTRSSHWNNTTEFAPKILINPASKSATASSGNEKSKTHPQLAIIKQIEERYLQFLSDEGKVENIIESIEGVNVPTDTMLDFCSVRKRCIEQYHNITLQDPEYDKTHDVISHIWRMFYYRVIDLFRRNTILKERKDIYLKFLNTGLDEYKEFYKKLTELFQKEKVLIQRGDLFRYKALLLNNKPADFLKSEKYYNKALQLSRDFGNAWNQLAVISTYNNDIFLALYRYYRSLGSIHRPFSCTKDNIILLFKNNVPKMQGRSSYHLLTLHGKLFQQITPIPELEDDNATLIINDCFNEIPRNDTNYLLKATIMNLFVDQKSNSSFYSKVFNEMFFAKLVDIYCDNQQITSYEDIYASLVLYIEYFLQNRAKYLHENENLCQVICHLFSRIVNDEELSKHTEENTFYTEVLGYSPLNGNLGTFTTRNENSALKQSLVQLFDKQKNELVNDTLIPLFYHEKSKTFSTNPIEDDDESIMLNGDILAELNNGDDLILNDDDMTDVSHQKDRPVQSMTPPPSTTQISTTGTNNIWQSDTALPETKNESPSSLAKLNVTSPLLHSNFIESPFRMNAYDNNDHLFNQRMSTPTNNGMSSPLIEKSTLMSKILSSPPKNTTTPNTAQSSTPSVFDSIFGSAQSTTSTSSNNDAWNRPPVGSQSNWGGVPSFLGGYNVAPNINVIYNPFGFNYPSMYGSGVGTAYPFPQPQQQPQPPVQTSTSPHSQTSVSSSNQSSGGGVLSFPFRNSSSSSSSSSCGTSSNSFNLFD